jgi:hypothetical protein
VPVGELVGYPLLLHMAEEAHEWRMWTDQAVAAFHLRVGRTVFGHGPSSHRDAVIEYGLPAFGPVDAAVYPGVVSRPLVSPRLLMPISVIWRAERRTDARLARVVTAIEQIAERRGWTTPPSTSDWLPGRAEGAPTPSG